MIRPPRAFELGCPPSLAPLAGCLAPVSPYDRMEQDARSLELTADVDGVPWERWIDGDPRLQRTPDMDSCGCPIWHWQGAENLKSATLHVGCEHGCGGHIWSGTMMGQLELDSDHVSRLSLSAALRGDTDLKAAAAAVGVVLGGVHAPLQSITDYLEDRIEAARAAGDAAEVASLEARLAAVESMPRPTIPAAPGAVLTAAPIAGGVAPAPHIPPPDAPTVGATALTPAPTLPVQPRLSLVQPPRIGTLGDPPRIGTLGVPPTPAAPAPVPPPMPTVQPAPETVTQFMADSSAVPPVLSAAAAAVRAQTAAWDARRAELEAQLWTMTPGLRRVAQAADAYGSGRFGVLAATLPRIAVAAGPGWWLPSANGECDHRLMGGSLNYYGGLIGEPAAGKTLCMAAAEALVPLHESCIVNSGTGQGLMDSFGCTRLDKESVPLAGAETAPGGVEIAPRYVTQRRADRIFMEADEGEDLIKDMTAEGSKTGSTWRSVWVGARHGTNNRELSRRVSIAKRTYAAGMTFAAQPEILGPMWAEAGRGTPQRILWAAVERCTKRGTAPEAFILKTSGYPMLQQGQSETIWYDMSTPRRWLPWPPAARAYIEARDAAHIPDPFGERRHAERLEAGTDVDGDGDEVDFDVNNHLVFLRLKTMALLTLMDGLTEPGDVHWEAAGIIVELSQLAAERAQRAAARAARRAAEALGTERGIVMAAANRSRDAATDAYRQDIRDKIMRHLETRGPADERTITRNYSPKQRAAAKTELPAMAAANPPWITVDAAGVYRLA